MVNWKLYKGVTEGRYAKRSMKAFEEFCELLENENYKLIGDYVNATTKVEIECDKQHRYFVKPNNFKNLGQRCPICSGKSKEYAKLDFIKQVENEGYTLIGEYKNVMTKVELECDKQHRYFVIPSSFKSGCRCPICSGKSKEYAKLDFIKQVENEGYKLIGDYINNKIKVELECDKHHRYLVRPKDFKKGSRCPICSGSYGERITYEFLTNLGLEFEIQKTFEGLIGVKGGGLLRYDFYISSLNLLLEINGNQHYDSVGLFGGEEALLIQIENDNRKKAFARAMGMNLVEIKCNSENDGDKLKEELDKVINEYVFRFFGRAS